MNNSTLTPDLTQLSPRETQILQATAQGKARKQIADELHISVHTYDTYRKNIRTKLNIQSQADWARILTQMIYNQVQTK